MVFEKYFFCFVILFINIIIAILRTICLFNLVHTELKSAEDRKQLVDAEVTEMNAEKSRLSDELASLNVRKAEAEESVAIHKQMAPYESVEELWDAIKRLQE